MRAYKSLILYYFNMKCYQAIKKGFFSIKQYKNTRWTISYFPFSLKKEYVTISDIC